MSSWVDIHDDIHGAQKQVYHNRPKLMAINGWDSDGDFTSQDCDVPTITSKNFGVILKIGYTLW
jgi:hypothetical protein